MASLPAVRRLEAAGFRAWPAERVEYNGSWQMRLTPGHPTTRPNCVVPLDPGDTRDVARRVSALEAIYAAAGVSIAFKETPLCPPELVAYLSSNGWTADSESIVETLPLGDAVFNAALDIIPSHDVSLFVDACHDVENGGRPPREAMHRLFSAIQPEMGMFIMSDGNAQSQAVALCVRDGDYAGLQQVAVSTEFRGQGLGFEITASALKWAKLRGATTAWLQVDAANRPAVALYDRVGFEEVYRYRYWRREKAL